MKNRDPKVVPERGQTDKSLKVERVKSDIEMGKRSRATDERSDQVLGRARGRADDVLVEARAQADVTSEREGISAGDKHAVHDERALQDAAVLHERQTADGELDAERRERERALKELLRFEREETDQRLLLERERGDKDLVAKEVFMSMVSHDVRTLLGCIAMAAGLQIKGADAPDAGHKAARNAHMIQRFTARVNRLVGDLVDISGIEAGNFSITPTQSDAALLLTESMDAFQPAAAHKGIALEADVPDRQVMAAFDHDRVLQVLANLLSNALKFTPEGGRITLKLQDDGGQLRFIVSDTGPGVEEAQVEAMFERFWQATKNDTRGLGLGLFISRCIVEAHGGRIWAESEVGKGTAVIFTLPANAAN